MRILIIFLILVSTEAFSQQTTEWVKSLESPKYPSWELKPANVLSDHIGYDYSDLLNPKSDFLGFIGTDYRRIQVYFNSIKKSENTPNLYFVTGKSTVFKNTCDFEGTITIEQVREFKNMHLGVDEMYKDAGFKAQGIIIGRYRFSENPEQSHVGIFDGVMTLWWYIDKNGEIKYDNLETFSDNYKNNQFVGTWKEYGKTNSKVCNWGEYRIPFSGDLDWGAGEFSVNPKYYEKGWEDFDRN